MHYFAYGSNMLSARLLARVPEARALGAAMLIDHELFCDKRSVDGSGKFTIVAQAGGCVPGVLYNISQAGRAGLDAFEGPGYAAVDVEVEVGGQPHTALVYVAHSDWRDASLKPYDWYLAFARAGAIEHDLPAPHQARLHVWPSQPDQNTERAALNRAILAGQCPTLARQAQWPC